jgi:hypothetical protein
LSAAKRITENLAEVSFNEDFWPIYPRKVARSAALKSYNSKGKTAEARAEIIAGLKLHLPGMMGKYEENPEFVPHGSTWLNQERWKDPVEPSGRPKTRPLSVADQLMAEAVENDRKRGLA